MLLPPAFVMASWPAPNYVSPQNHGPGLLVVNVVLLVVVLVVIGIRYYTRIRVTKTFGLDDFLIGVALVDTLLFLWRMINLIDRSIDSNHWPRRYNDQWLSPLKVRPTHLGRPTVDNHVRYQIRSRRRSPLLRRVNTNQAFTCIFLPSSYR